MRTWFVATAKLKQPIRTAIIEDDPALRKMIVSRLQHHDPRAHPTVHGKFGLELTDFRTAVRRSG
jgi:hypothetical protein